MVFQQASFSCVIQIAPILLLLGIVSAAPVSVRQVWAGRFNDVAFDGQGLAKENGVIVSTDSNCLSGDTLEEPRLVGGVLRFAAVEDLPDSGYFCWCPQAHPCSNGVAFPFSLEGPDGDLLTLSVIVGTKFQVTVEGTMLSENDRLLFSTECGQPRAKTGFVVQDKPSMRYGQRFDAYVTTTDLLLMCWCPGVRGCANDTMFSTHIGNVTAIGPEFGKVMHVSAGEEFSVVLTTEIASANDFVRITKKGECSPKHTDKLAYKVCDPNSCSYRNNGSPSHFDNETERWDHFLLTEKNEYSICWCHDSSYDPVTGESYSAACRTGTASAFTADVGTVIVSGVDLHNFQCEAWKECRITFGKVGDGVVVVPNETPCDGISIFSPEGIYLYDNGFTVPSSPPGTRRLCYCDFDITGYCDHGSAFRQVLGTIVTEGSSIWRPQDMFQCTTESCSVEISGIGFDPGDRIAMVKNCPFRSNEPIFQISRYTPNSAIFQVDGPLTAGPYQLCFCSFAQSLSGCTSHFLYPMGNLLVISASVVDYQPECRLGLPCDITIESLFPIENGDAIRIDGDGFGKQQLVIAGITNRTTFKTTVTTATVTAEPREDAYKISFCSQLGKIQGVEKNCDNGQGFIPIGHIFVTTSLIPPLKFVNPTSRVVTVEVESPFFGGSTYCAAAATNQSSIPTTAQIANLEIANPLGSGVLRTTSKGINYVHVDFGEVLINGAIDEARIWCARNANCTHMRCTLPHDSDGAIVQIESPAPSATKVQGIAGDTVEIVVEGSLGLNAKLRIEGGDWHHCVGDDNRCTSEFFFPVPGIYKVEFCDRFIFDICSIEVPVTEVTILGIFPASLEVPTLVQPLTKMSVVLHGIGMDQLHDFRSCYQNSTSDITLVESNFTTSVWTLTSGEDGTYDQLCFFAGENRVDEGTEFYAETFQDCVVGEWAWETECSVTCGRGGRFQRRPILVQPIGRGAGCPETEGEKPCGVPCPPVFLHGARVVEGDTIFVDSPFQIDVHIENGDQMDRVLITSRLEACGDRVRVASGAACERASADHLLCGNTTGGMKIHAPGQFRACFCDASSENGCLESVSYSMDLEIFITIIEETVAPTKKTTSTTTIILVAVGGAVIGFGSLFLLVKKLRPTKTPYTNQTSPADRNSVAQDVLREVWKSYNRLDHWKDGEKPAKDSKTFLGMSLTTPNHEGPNNANISHTSGWTSSTGYTTADASKHGPATHPGDSMVHLEVDSPTPDSPVFWSENSGDDNASDGMRLGESASFADDDDRSLSAFHSLRLHANMFGTTQSECRYANKEWSEGAGIGVVDAEQVCLASPEEVSRNVSEKKEKGKEEKSHGEVMDEDKKISLMEQMEEYGMAKSSDNPRNLPSDDAYAEPSLVPTAVEADSVEIAENASVVAADGNRSLAKTKKQPTHNAPKSLETLSLVNGTADSSSSSADTTKRQLMGGKQIVDSPKKSVRFNMAIRREQREMKKRLRHLEQQQIQTADVDHHVPQAPPKASQRKSGTWKPPPLFGRARFGRDFTLTRSAAKTADSKAYRVGVSSPCRETAVTLKSPMQCAGMASQGDANDEGSLFPSPCEETCLTMQSPMNLFTDSLQQSPRVAADDINIVEVSCPLDPQEPPCATAPNDDGELLPRVAPAALPKHTPSTLSLHRSAAPPPLEPTMLGCTGMDSDVTPPFFFSDAGIIGPPIPPSVPAPLDTNVSEPGVSSKLPTPPRRPKAPSIPSPPALHAVCISPRGKSNTSAPCPMEPSISGFLGLSACSPHEPSSSNVQEFLVNEEPGCVKELAVPDPGDSVTSACAAVHLKKPQKSDENDSLAPLCQAYQDEKPLASIPKGLTPCANASPGLKEAPDPKPHGPACANASSGPEEFLVKRSASAISNTSQRGKVHLEDSSQSSLPPKALFSTGASLWEDVKVPSQQYMQGASAHKIPLVPVMPRPAASEIALLNKPSFPHISKTHQKCETQRKNDAQCLLPDAPLSATTAPLDGNAEVRSHLQPRGSGAHKIIPMSRRVVPRPPMPQPAPNPLQAQNLCSYTQYGQQHFGTYHQPEGVRQHAEFMVALDEQETSCNEQDASCNEQDAFGAIPASTCEVESMCEKETLYSASHLSVSSAELPRGISLAGRHSVGAKKTPMAKPTGGNYRREFGTKQRQFAACKALGRSTGKYKLKATSDSDSSPCD